MDHINPQDMQNLNGSDKQYAPPQEATMERSREKQAIAWVTQHVLTPLQQYYKDMEYKLNGQGSTAETVAKTAIEYARAIERFKVGTSMIQKGIDKAITRSIKNARAPNPLEFIMLCNNLPDMDQVKSECNSAKRAKRYGETYEFKHRLSELVYQDVCTLMETESSVTLERAYTDAITKWTKVHMTDGLPEKRAAIAHTRSTEDIERQNDVQERGAKVHTDKPNDTMLARIRNLTDRGYRNELREQGRLEAKYKERRIQERIANQREERMKAQKEIMQQRQAQQKARA